MIRITSIIMYYVHKTKRIMCIINIDCRKCGIEYVGKTVQSFKERAGQHLRSVEQRQDCPVSRHFNSNGHSVRDLEFIGIEKDVKSKKIRERERYFIDKLKAVEYGLNVYRT